MKNNLNLTTFCKQALLAACALTVGFGAAAQAVKTLTPAEQKIANDKAAIAAAVKTQAETKPKTPTEAEKAAAEKEAMASHAVITPPSSIKKNHDKK